MSYSEQPKHRALEIGGPTLWFEDLYSEAMKIDNVIQRVGDGYGGGNGAGGEFIVIDGNGKADTFTNYPFIVKGMALGTTYLRHGANLTGLPMYDLVISSHSLEHFTTPLEALFEWNRLLRPDGYFILILPSPPKTFDKHRSPHNIFTLLRKVRHSDS